VAIKKNTTNSISKKETKSNKTSVKSSKAKKATEDTTPAPQEGQQYILNGVSITTAATSLTNESLAAMCDFEKAFGATTQQQEQFDQQIQLQLQSILNGSAAAQLAKPKSPVQTRPAEPSPIKQVESMPSGLAQSSQTLKKQPAYAHKSWSQERSDSAQAHTEQSYLAQA